MLSLSCRRESPQKKPRNQTSAKVNQKTLVPEQMLDSLIEFIRERGGSTAVADMEEFYRMHPELGAKQVVAQCGGLRSFCGRNKHLIAYRAGCISLRNSASHTGHSSTSSPSSLDQEAEQSTAGERNIGRSGQHHHEENRHLHQQLEARRLVEQENEAAASVAASLLLKLSRTIQSPALTPTALSPREPCAVTSKEHGSALVISESPAFLRPNVSLLTPASQREQGAQRTIVPKLPVLQQQEPLVISESPLTSSPRTPRITSPRAKQHTVSGNSSPRSRKYGSSGLMLRAEPAPLILQTRQSVCGAEEDNEYFIGKMPKDLAEGSEMSASTAPALGPSPLSVASTPTVADGAGSWT
eukprot:Tamp_04027.p2 GENE.Tamp_04027~~Tamp_04027.p2  ORF type:complete len:356 (-),score=25.00 Tamp_04027:365-1432(-)